APASVAVVKTASAGVSRSRSSGAEDQRDRDADRDQYHGEHLKRILLRKGRDLRPPASEQQLLHGAEPSVSGYFSEEFTEVNLVLSVPPIPLTATTITMLS